MKIMKIKEVEESDNSFVMARRIMRDNLKKDNDLFLTYKSNIAMRIWDLSCVNGKKRLSAKKCNEIAENLIDLIFE